MRRQPPICIDFDAVLNVYDGRKGEHHYDEPRKGAKEFLTKLKNAGLKFTVLTTRPADKVALWFKKYDFPEPEQITNQKIPAAVYIDDRALKFNGDYDKLLDELKNFNVFWKSKKIFEDYLK